MRDQRDQHETGLTMIELMVALAIVSILIVGIIKVFGSSYESYVTQNDVASMQQNIRVAKIFLEKDLRRLGYEMGDDFVWLGERLPSFEFDNGAGENGSDRFMLRYANMLNDCGPPLSGTTSCSDLPQLHLDTKFLGSESSEAEVQEDMTISPFDAWDQDCSCGGLLYESPQPKFIGIIRDPERTMSDTFILTQVQPNSSKIQNHPVNNYNGPITALDGEDFDNKVLNDYPENSTVEFFSFDSLVDAQYYVQNGFLWRQDNQGAQRIAEHIEDMQFAFCGDFNNDGNVDLGDAGDWLDEANLTAGGDLTEDDRAKVRYIRVTLLGRTLREHEKLDSTRPAIEDHAAAGGSDHFRRRLLQVTVQLRNVALGL